MNEQQDRLAREREEIAARVASFKATQEKFEREREEYYATTLGKPGADLTARRSGPSAKFPSVRKSPERCSGLFSLLPSLPRLPKPEPNGTKNFRIGGNEPCASELSIQVQQPCQR